MAQSLAGLAMRRSSKFNMGPWFLEALASLERALASNQTWDFRGNPCATNRSLNELQRTFALRVMPQNNLTYVSFVSFEALVRVR